MPVVGQRTIQKQPNKSPNCAFPSLVSSPHSTAATATASRANQSGKSAIPLPLLRSSTDSACAPYPFPVRLPYLIASRFPRAVRDCEANRN